MASDRDDKARALDTPSLLGSADTAAGDGVASASPTSPVSGGATPAMRAVAVGDTVGRYELLEEIGEGGMATVYRARDQQLRREVAVKVLFPHLAKRSDVVRRFAREARAAAALEHPNILRVLDVGVPDGTSTAPPFLVMELIRGQSLAEFTQANAPLPPEHAAAMVAELAGALQLAHAAGIVHRDIKPANVMATTDGRLLLTDFGVAQVATDESLVTRTGALLGTPAYMSPEQAVGEDITAASDVYSLAVTLYQMVTGELPYGGSTAKVLSQIASGSAAPADRKVPAVGAELARIIAHAMAPTVAARTPSAAQFADELSAFVQHAGWGDNRALVKELLADPAKAQARAPSLVDGLLRRASAALASRKQALASGLAERAAALAPTDPRVVAMLSTVARGSRGPRRQWIVGGVAAATVATAGIVGWNKFGHAPSDVRNPDAPLLDAAAIDASLPTIVDAATAVPLDARVSVDAARLAVDARSRSVDAARRIDAAAKALMSDAAAPVAVALLDAPPVVDMVADNAKVTLVMDSWCDVTIDGEAKGRLRRGQPYSVAPGQHTIACGQGVGMAEWHTSFTATPGQQIALTGTLLMRVRITAGLGVPISIAQTKVANGASLVLPTGRYPVAMWDGDTIKPAQWVAVPAVPACTLRLIAGAIECAKP